MKNKPEQWPAFIKRIECFRKASNVEGQPQEKQIHMLLYGIMMREEAEELLTSFHLSTTDVNIMYYKVKEAFHKHDVIHNVIFERAVDHS